MAHYALVNKENRVLEVIVLSNEEIMNQNTGEDDPIKVQEKKEEIYGDFDARLIKTSYNNNLNGKYAQIGWTYDENIDIFIPPRPDELEDFIFDQNIGDWIPPTQAPQLTQQEIDLGLTYIWNSGNYTDEPRGWVIDIRSDYEYLSLTEEELKNGCLYIWNRQKYLTEGIFECYLHCPPPILEDQSNVGIAST
jgi:hypothetical protein